MNNAIQLFLDNWKISAKRYYTGVKEDMQRTNATKEIDYKEIVSTTHNGCKMTTSVYSQWMGAMIYKYGKGTVAIVKNDFYRVDELIEKEAQRKYKKLIDTIEKKAGSIVDARGLKVSENMELNGVVVGTKATVMVDTISAGGYNVQCFHYRTKVKEIK